MVWYVEWTTAHAQGLLPSVFFFASPFECTGETLHAHATQRTHRYDARLLLDALPSLTSIADQDYTVSNDDAASGGSIRPDSPGGWSDLPSDAEDTFFLTPDETSDLHRTKRLRHLDALRNARLRALPPDDATNNNASVHPDAWGGSDEEVKQPYALP
jgi:hypothetical protein